MKISRVPAATRPPVQCRQVEAAEIPRAVNVQLASFVADPIMRWLWPEAHEYVTCFPRLVDGFGGGAFDNDAADVTDGFLGGALWLPPGVSPNEQALDALFKETLGEPQRSEILSVLEQMGESHPDEEHWHLAFIGVDAAHQGRGVGAELMRHRLAKLDAVGAVAYLESSNPRNIPFYQRHGFEVLREIQVGGSPPVFPMLRAAR
jgi:ribosomal protein S18 acetylase RimI-like enzyme